MTTTNQIKSATKKVSFNLANSIIENSGLELELIQDLPFMKQWSVKNNKEITGIISTKKIYDNDFANIGFIWKC